MKRSFRAACAAIAVVLPLLTWSGAAQAALVGHWNFNEGSGSTALDSSGNGYTGVINGTAVRVAGPTSPGPNPAVFGTALSFSAANLNHVQITGSNSAAHPLAIAGIPNYTISWWLNYSAGARFVNKQDPFANLSGYSMRTAGATTNLQMTLGTNVDTGLLLSAGTWHHWAVTYDLSAPAAQRAKVYRDGVLGFTFNPGGNLADDAASPLVFGAYFRASNSTYGQHLTGLLDDIRIYNNTLNAAEIHDLIYVPEPGMAMLLPLAAAALLRRARR